MFEKQSTIYTLTKRGRAIEKWTYITKDKGNGYYVVIDPKGRYRQLSNLEGFSASPESCEIQVFKNKLKRFQKEKVELYAEIRRQKEKIANHQKIIDKRKLLIKTVDKKISGIHKGYKRLLDEFPEEFI